MKRLSVIIDKNIFQPDSALQRLTDLAEYHTVIIPHILLEECLTTESDPGPRELLEKAEVLIKAGAFVSLSQGRMLEIEKESLQPLKSVIDEAATEQVRSNTIRDIEIDIQNEAEECAKCFEPLLQFVERLTRAFWKTLSAKEYSADWRQPGDDNERVRRLIKWRRATCVQMKQWLGVQFPSIHQHITNEWVTWHVIQFLVVYGIEWAFKRNQSGQSFEDFDITNDVYDLNYLSCLCLSDGLISRDRGLREFTQALLPKKTIYTSVPEISKYCEDKA